MRSLIFAFLLACSVSTTAHAAPRSDVLAVADMVLDPSIPVLSRTTGTSGGQIVFVENGIRYTIYHSGARINPRDPNSAWLAIWTRPNGTSGQGSIQTFSDSGFDGTVDSGVWGTSQRELFDSGIQPYGTAQGVEYRAVWQQRYDAAIAAALRYKAEHQR